jgi:hypothetical protein
MSLGGQERSHTGMNDRVLDELGYYLLAGAGARARPR